ncbi:MAG TPA: hypothetical protein VNE39_05455 [Planctomycetota bacterium]|nr:hypothetical protein [Planctomycetota bacterium]
MRAYRDLHVYFGDLHNHCGISYGHGSLDEALANAREQLDFCSVTGHAHWPDMPPPDPRIQYILDFHHEGFAKLKAGWPAVLDTLRGANEEGRFVVFPSFEIHFCATGDRTVLYRDLGGEILYADDLDDLHRRLRALATQGSHLHLALGGEVRNEDVTPAIAFPHHLGYRRGARGVNWDAFDPAFAPVVEIVSMHGCSEGSENPRPFLHSMGPSDWESTMQCGLGQGHVFGVVGGTDHHSAHPGSYGHGRAALWAAGLTREALWDALMARRTCALTGDRIALQLALNDAPMGAVVPLTRQRHIEIRLEAGGAIDCLDLVKNNRLLRRWSECDVPQAAPSDPLHTKLFLEVGWGEKRKETAWDIRLGISEGRILAVEPRFRGQEIVSPVEKQAGSSSHYHTSHWERDGERAVHFATRSIGHPNNVTNTAQGMCLEVEMPLGGAVEAILNGQRVSIPLRRLVAGAKSGNLGGIDSPAWRLHRAPLPWEFRWEVSLDDADDAPAFYYARVRQKNDQWAWASPIFVR